MALQERFRDRFDAGRALAGELSGDLAGRPDVLVLALPRGGAPVASEVARALGAPLDVFVVRKLGVPGQEELAMGAIASGGVRVENPSVIRMLGIQREDIDRVAADELKSCAAASATTGVIGRRWRCGGGRWCWLMTA